VPESHLTVAEQSSEPMVNECRRRSHGGQARKGGLPMLYWAVVFLVIAIIAGLFGFGGIASASAGIAQILFVVFLILLAASLIMYFVRGRRPPA
jgi:uncharacterized membrane protein YtjA (UPF0391 family)